ncbi:hypothetical protein K4K58_011168 [Colletotrichum sp. SAR11_239]|nr:hypothetical protein K4K58_011168 [Colletotrichum sp. SAR11_239]
MASVLGKRKAPSANVSKKSAPATATKKSSSSASKAAAAAATKKRKTSGTVKPQPSRKPEAEAQEADEATMDAQEIFRRHFEAAFAPLPGTAGAKRKAKKSRAAANAEESEEEEEDDEEEEDLDEDVGVDDEDGWGGVSDEDEEDDDEGENVVEVVDHSSSKPLPPPSMSKRELKAFMSSKPPSQTDPNPTTPATESPADEDDENDKSMLANDLALQRLLSESHLLAKHNNTSSSTSSEPKSFAAGKLRQRQLDMRMQSLAPGVASLFKQDKMPMAQRKGIVAKAAQRETTRRRQAKENGVVLEREAPAPKKKSGGGRGERSVGGPSVGLLSS